MGGLECLKMRQSSIIQMYQHKVAELIARVSHLEAENVDLKIKLNLK